MTRSRTCSESIVNERATSRGLKTMVPGVALRSRRPRKSHLTLDHVERLVFPMMDVRRRRVALAGN
jgi:hypothetical protein